MRVEGGGNPDGEGDLQGLKPLTGQEEDAGEVLEVAFDGVEGVVVGSGDFLGLLAFGPVADGLAFVGDGRADVLLLAAGGDDDAARGLEMLDVAANGAHIAGQEVGEPAVWIGF